MTDSMIFKETIIEENNKHPLIASEFICNDFNEKLLFHRMPCIGNTNGIVITSNQIGSIFCCIINNSETIINVLETACMKFVEQIEKNKNSDTNLYSSLSNTIEQLVADLALINPFLQVIDLQLSQLMQFISNDLNNRALNNSAFDYEDFGCFCKKHFEFRINEITYTILSYKEQINSNTSKINNIFVLPTSNKKLFIPDGYIQFEDIENYTNVNHKKFKTKKQIAQYRYNIKSLEELLDVSFYQILLQHFHIRKCAMCGKIFTCKTKQSFCDNISDINPNKTCNQLKLHLVSQSNFIYEIDTLNEQYKNLCQFFSDHSKNTKKYTKVQRDQILKNKTIFMNFICKVKKKFKSYIDEKDKCNNYLRHYKEYLDQIYDQTHKKKDFNINKITKEYLPKFELTYKDIKILK